MTLVLIVFRSLRQHLLSTVVTALSVALAGGLLMAVWAVKTQAQATFAQTNTGFDAVLGARGSKLQLVLNAVFHLEASPGNLAAADYEYIRKHPAVRTAIPIAVGDNLRGFRIVGTLPALFTDVEYAPGKKFALASGRLWTGDAREAVIGSFAAERLGLRTGDTFQPFHGLVYDEDHQHAETYVVTGILESSNTPADRVVWIPLRGVQTMAGHDPRAADDVSAVLIKLRSPAAGFSLDMMYNKQGNRLTFAYPIGAVMAELFGKIGWFDRVLALIAYLVAVVSAGGVVVAIYNSMSARRRDIAILRALGARRRTIFGAVVLEATALGVLGMIMAFAVYGVIVAVVAAVIRAEVGVVITPFAANAVMGWAPAGMILLCALGGLLPAWKAYRTDVAAHLAPVS
ncbi:MAG: ABC transporter permease [Rariglobus sp.]